MKLCLQVPLTNRLVMKRAFLVKNAKGLFGWLV